MRFNSELVGKALGTIAVLAVCLAAIVAGAIFAPEKFDTISIVAMILGGIGLLEFTTLM